MSEPTIEKWFGDIRWLQWSLSSRGYEWRAKFGAEWDAMLAASPELDPLDLLLDSVGILCRPRA